MVLSTLLPPCSDSTNFVDHYCIFLFLFTLEIVGGNIDQKLSFFAAFIMSNCSPCTSSICIWVACLASKSSPIKPRPCIAAGSDMGIG